MLGQFEEIDAALLAFWTDKAQAELRHADYRDAVARGNGHLTRVAQALADVCRDAGATDVVSRVPKKRLTLPGYFRPTKEWDVVAWHHGRPVAAIELKSQAGSFGNNPNNRAEEAVGNAEDLRRAVKSGLLPPLWTGFAFIIEDCDKSNSRSKNQARSELPTDDEFAHWTYAERVRVLCERLQATKSYDATWAVATSRPPDFNWRDLASDVTWQSFSESLRSHLQATFR